MSDDHATMSWHIGRDDEEQPMGKKKWKAYFYWKQGGVIVDSKILDKDELKSEIDRLKQLGLVVSEYEKAYNKL